MKRVLFLVNHDVVIYNFRKELVERLLEEKYTVIISSPYGERIEYLKQMGCQYIPVDLERHGKNPIKEIKLLAYYKKLLLEIKPDIVFSYTIKPNLYGALAAWKTKTPIVINITGLGLAVENDGLMQKLVIQAYRFAFRNVQTVFLQNQENLDFFLNSRIALGKLKLLPGSGVNLFDYTPQEYPQGVIINFCFIARVMKEKGIEQYLKAAERIKERYSNVNFHICGFCEQGYETIINELHDKGLIIYHGMVNDMHIIYKNMNCIVHPTYYPEGLSNVLLESAASARPIITTDRSGCREVIEDGVNGFICRQKDSDDLTLKIEKFLQLTWEEQRKMGLAAREKVEKEFDRNIVVNAYLQEIKEKEDLLAGEISGL